MDFTKLVFFIVSTIGLTNILVDGMIFDGVRTLLRKCLPVMVYKVFECHQCMGTWAGFLCGYFIFGADIFIIACCGFAGSFAAVLGSLAISYIESKIMMEQP